MNLPDYLFKTEEGKLFDDCFERIARIMNRFKRSGSRYFLR